MPSKRKKPQPDGPRNLDTVMEYARSIAEGRKAACRMAKLACKRFLDDLQNPAFDFRTENAEFVIRIIESTFVHKKGERLDGTPLVGSPFLLEPFHKFIIYNLLGFYRAGTKVTRYHEAFIYIPRKNIKTTFAAALAYALGLLYRKSGSKIYLVAASLKQALESFDFIRWNIEQMGEGDAFIIHNSQNDHSIRADFGRAGSFNVEALASNPDAQDSFNCNIAICDEIHAYKIPKQYNLFKEAMKAYSNKLMIGITTAGDNINSFCYQKLKYCKKVLEGTVKDEQYFVFIAEADPEENGEIDFTNPAVHEMANPAYGVSIRPDEILNDSLQALNDPQQRKDFLAKSLNVYTSALKAYFDLDEFRRSDKKYSWTLKELARLPVDWYGGADLAKLHDLTAAALYGNYKGVDIVITHAWFPVTAARQKAEEDNIPLFGWKDEGWLDLCNSPTANHADIVNWFVKMRAMGFKIRSVGHDRKFCREYFRGMKKAGFKIVDQPQYYYVKSEGFRHIEVQAKNGTLYYLHSDAFEYCVENVSAVEKTDDMVAYEKVSNKMRIDLFDAAVFACIRMLAASDSANSAESWYQSKKGGDT